MRIFVENRLLRGSLGGDECGGLISVMPSWPHPGPEAEARSLLSREQLGRLNTGKSADWTYPSIKPAAVQGIQAVLDVPASVHSLWRVILELRQGPRNF